MAHHCYQSKISSNEILESETFLGRQYKVNSSTSHTKTFNGVRVGTLCWPISQHLGPMNLDVDILEYVHGDVFWHGCLRNKKLHTASVRVKTIVAEHATCHKHIKGIVHPKMKCTPWFTHPQGTVGVYDFVLSDKYNRNSKIKCPGTSKLYNGSEWGSRF